MGSNQRQAETCLVCTAGLLGAARRTAIGTALSRETRMRVFDDMCFLRLLQDAWLQEELKRSASPEGFMADLFKSRGHGPGTPFFPAPSIIVLIDGQRASDVRRQMLAKSAQTGDQEGTADVPRHYIEMLMQAYCHHIAEIGKTIRTAVIHISLGALPAFTSTNATEAGNALAAAVAEQLGHLDVRSTPQETTVSPSLSPQAVTTTRDVWTRVEPGTGPTTAGTAVVPLVF